MIRTTASSKAAALACSCVTAGIICCCYLQTISKVAREWRDHEEAQRYASTAVVRLVQAELSPSEAVRKKPPITTQQQMMLWPDSLVLVDGRASIKSGQRSRFATSAARSLLSTIHQQLKIHRANLLRNHNLSIAFTVQEETIVTLVTLITAS
jgi:hypothetical protein